MVNFFIKRQDLTRLKNMYQKHLNVCMKIIKNPVKSLLVYIIRKEGGVPLLKIEKLMMSLLYFVKVSKIKLSKIKVSKIYQFRRSRKV